VPRKKFAFSKGKNRSGKSTGSDAKGGTQTHPNGTASTGSSDGNALAAGSDAPGGGPESDDASRANSSAVAEATHCWAGKVGTSLLHIECVHVVHSDKMGK